MTALDHQTHVHAAGFTAAAVVARVGMWLRQLSRAVKNRRQVNRLGYLSDHELADIGLTRTDLAVVMRAPFGVDPTAQLSALTQERYSIEDGARRVS